MPSNVEQLLQLELQFKYGVAYLVPTKWWQQFKDVNEKTKDITDLVFPALNLSKFVDMFLIQFEEGIIAQLEHKSNYLKFNKIIFSPQIKRNSEWTLISPEIWRMINAKLSPKFPLLTLYIQQNPQLVLTADQTQIQIIFCSKTKSTLFVGFLPSKTDVLTSIRSIGYELNFVQMNNSRIIFPDRNPDKSYYFCEMENKILTDCVDTLFLVYNLESINEEDANKQAKLDFSFGKGEEMANSNQAMAGDVGALAIQSFQQVRNDGTMSTGAETPSFFGSDDENYREFRVRELFRQKTSEQIQQLRLKAKKLSNSVLISVREYNQQKIKQNLQSIEIQLIDHIQSHKKKTHKEKEVHVE